MKRFSLLLCLSLLQIGGAAVAADWYAALDGKADAAGTKAAPWDLPTSLGGGQKIAPGDTLWLKGGSYRFMPAKVGGYGYEVRLAGKEGAPITVRAVPGERATIDGGLAVLTPSTYLIIRDLEITVTDPRPAQAVPPDPTYGNTNRPWGGLNVYSGTGCKFINLVIHDNNQGVSWWNDSHDSELYGCLIYDNGWQATDRGHGHAIYTQNQEGVKTISDCIMTGGFGYSLHAYGSSRAYVDNYVAEGNIVYDAGQFLVGGGRPSKNIRVRWNYLFNTSMRIGYGAENEDCYLDDNVIAKGALSVEKYKVAKLNGNSVLAPNDPKPGQCFAAFRKNRFDSKRAHLVIYNWPGVTKVPVNVGDFLKKGDRYELRSPRDFWGKPILTGNFEGGRLEVPVAGEFAAYVVVKR
jgi:hypothetical protein